MGDAGRTGRGSFPQNDRKCWTEKGQDLCFKIHLVAAGVWARVWTGHTGTSPLPVTSRALVAPHPPLSWTGRGIHLFSMACRNSSKVRKGVPSPQMPKRLM